MNLTRAAYVGVGAALGGAALVFGAPVVVSVIGFGVGGIVAGSAAASMMSAMAPTATGGVVATLQSVGAAGLGASGTAALATVGSTIGGTIGGVANYIFRR